MDATLDREALDEAVRRRELCARAAAWCRDGVARNVRHRAGLSARDVAALVGVTNPTILRWERGQGIPRGDAGVRYGELLEELMQP